MLDNTNPFAKFFRMARDRFKNNLAKELRLRLINTREKDGREYNILVAFKVISLIVGDLTTKNIKRDIIALHNKEGLQRIVDLYPSLWQCSIHCYFHMVKMNTD